MNCISLWEPWASLIANSLKRVETRHWPAPPSAIGQPIAIHAAKRWTREQDDLLQSWPFADVALPDPLPLGCVVAVARLVACRQMTGATVRYAEAMLREADAESLPCEFHFGDYAVGRWAWCLDHVIPLTVPIPARGAQGIWRWEPEDALVEVAR